MSRKRYRITPMGYIVLTIMALVVIVSIYFIVWSISNKVKENNAGDVSATPNLVDVVGDITPSPTLPPVDVNTTTPDPAATDSLTTNTPGAGVIITPTPTPSATPTPTPTPTVSVSIEPTSEETKNAYNGQLTGSGVALRSGPTTSDKIIVKLDKNTVVVVYGTYGDYYKVQVVSSKTYGFVASKFIGKVSAPDGMINGTVTASKLAIRSEPSTDSKAKGELVNGDAVYVLFKTDDFYYIQVVATSVTGYVKASYVKADETVPTGTPVP